jgi:hypothetical protein
MKTKLKITIADDQGIVIDQIELWTPDLAAATVALIDKISSCGWEYEADLDQFLKEENA